MWLVVVLVGVDTDVLMVLAVVLGVVVVGCLYRRVDGGVVCQCCGVFKQTC